MWQREGTVVPRGSRLTPDRLAQVRISEDFLSKAEKELFVDILFEYEGAVAFDDSETGDAQAGDRAVDSHIHSTS